MSDVLVGIDVGASGSKALLIDADGAGVYPDVAEACRRTIKLTRTTEPGKAQRVYADYYPRNRALYPALAGEFKKLASVVRDHLED